MQASTARERCKSAFAKPALLVHVAKSFGVMLLKRCKHALQAHFESSATMSSEEPLDTSASESQQDTSDSERQVPARKRPAAAEKNGRPAPAKRQAAAFKRPAAAKRPASKTSSTSGCSTSDETDSDAGAGVAASVRSKTQPESLDLEDVARWALLLLQAEKPDALTRIDNLFMKRPVTSASIYARDAA